MSNIEFIKNDGTRTIFVLKNSNPAFANSLRRLMIDSVPTMAIEDVEFRTNNSALYDEILAHRLGLMPLTTDLKTYNLPQKCKCDGEGCALCTVKLVLKKKGPGEVYASDIKSKDPKIKPVFPKMLLLKLLGKQDIELEATAVLGQGKNHVKWSSCLAWYNYYPKITVNNNSSKFEEFKSKYPQQVFKGGNIDKKAILELNLVDAVEGVCDDIVKVEYDDKNFLFYIEPWGQLSAKEILNTALELFSKGLEELNEQLK